MTMRWLPTKRTLPWWLLIVSLAFNLGFSTTYGVRTYGPIAGPGPGPEPRPHRARWHEPLHLDTRQRREVRRINEAMFEEVGMCRQEMDEARWALADLVAADEPDRDAIATQLDRISSMQRQLEGLVVDSLLAQKELLRPDQMQAFKESVRERLFPPQGGPGRGGAPGHGPGRGGRGGGQPGRGGRGFGPGQGGGAGHAPPEEAPDRGP
jgi:Spy/CpxP family protein refolding chaperone